MGHCTYQFKDGSICYRGTTVGQDCGLNHEPVDLNALGAVTPGMMLPNGKVSVRRSMVDHSTHGRADHVQGPEFPDCPCRGTPQQTECAEASCGFCRVAVGDRITVRDAGGDLVPAEVDQALKEITGRVTKVFEQLDGLLRDQVAIREVVDAYSALMSRMLDTFQKALTTIEARLSQLELREKSRETMETPAGGSLRERVRGG